MKAACELVRTAARNRASLTGQNFYANKLATLRADATNAFRDLSERSVGDVTALAEMVQLVFSATTDKKRRLHVARELVFALQTTWRERASVQVDDALSLFPLGVLATTNRGYLVTIGNQMNGCFASGWYDACAVMMRRLLETAILEAFEGKGISQKLKKPTGDFPQLTELIGAALAEPCWNLSKNTRKALPQLRDLGHQSAHSRRFTAQRSDLERVRPGCRVVIEEFLHLAGLLAPDTLDRA